ncbi:AraC family transcriptional regulator, partial [Pseudoalteromonas sp. SIMBA_162]
GVMLGGISTGTRELARAGLLDGYRATIHWQRAESFRRDFPQVNVSHQLYELDRDRVTCGGGTAAMDMMMTLIAQQHGRALAEKVSEHFV